MANSIALIEQTITGRIKNLQKELTNCQQEINRLKSVVDREQTQSRPRKKSKEPDLLIQFDDDDENERDSFILSSEKNDREAKSIHADQYESNLRHAEKIENRIKNLQFSLNCLKSEGIL